MKAKDCKCTRCGKQAVVFVGLNDPDATDYPMCRKCADSWKVETTMDKVMDIEFSGAVLGYHAAKAGMSLKQLKRKLNEWKINKTQEKEDGG